MRYTSNYLFLNLFKTPNKNKTKPSPINAPYKNSFFSLKTLARTKLKRLAT